MRAKADEIRALAATGASMGAIAAQLGIGKGSVHRALEALREQVPGYAENQDASSHLARQMEHVDAGTKDLSSSVQNAQWPTDYSREFSSLSPREQTARLLGQRGTIEPKGEPPGDQVAHRRMGSE